MIAQFWKQFLNANTFYRFMFGIGMVMDVLAGYSFSSLPNSYEPMVDRYIVSILSGILLLFSFFPGFKSYLYEMLLIQQFALQLDIIFIVIANGFRVEYAMGLVVMYFVSSFVVHNKTDLKVISLWSSFCLALFLIFATYVFHVHQNLVIVVFSELICIAVFFWSNYRLSMQEIIETKVRERTLELSVERAKLLASINAFRGPYILTDSTGSIILSNGQLKDFVVGDEPNNIQQLNDVLGSNELLNLWQRLIADGKPKEKLGIQFGSRFLRLSLSPVYLEQQSKLFGILVLITDETEEQILSRSKDEFITITSHELRTPLTAISGYTWKIMRYAQEKLHDEEVISLIKNVLTASQRLDRIVNDFLDTSQLEQGMAKFELVKFNVIEVIKAIISEYQELAEEKNVNFVIQNKAGHLIILADKERLKQVISNLISNALKATQQGNIIISLINRDNGVEVHVSDTGHGIELSNQNLLFHKFQHAGKNFLSPNSVHASGLGLYISRLLMTGMQGKIWLVHSKPDEGSEFAISLPLA